MYPKNSEIPFKNTFNDFENARNHSKTTCTSISTQVLGIENKKIDENEDENLSIKSMEIEFNNDDELLEPFRKLEILDMNHFSKINSYDNISFELPKNPKNHHNQKSL